MYRILRSIKNRFGSTAELGIYEMRQDGLRQVSNPSELLLSQDHEGMSGIAIASAIEGIRPFLIETQALVSSAVYGNPQRSATGFDIRRMNMLLAVLEKRVGFKLAQKDVFLNIAGGLKVNDPAIDLAVISAILSSNMDTAIEPEVCMAGEIGLSGEIRPVNRIEQRIGEAEKLGLVSGSIVIRFPPAIQPISPAIQTSGSIAVSILLESIALITARSIAGSFTFSPPAILRNTSFWASLKPTRFSSTANNIFILRISNPVAERCGLPYTALLTNACVSIKNGRIPSIAEAIAMPLIPS